MSDIEKLDALRRAQECYASASPQLHAAYERLIDLLTDQLMGLKGRTNHRA